ncbi:MAG: hypothetical protein GY861_17295 [bacterium]|nr:hypothetical protein [bacterium]
MTDKAIEKAVDNFNKAEKELEEALMKLENYGQECNCSGDDTIEMLHYGNWTEIQTFCTECGGVK